MYRVAVIGAAGFVGAEAVRLLLAHPGFELVAISSDGDAGKQLAEVYPSFSGRSELCFVSHEEVMGSTNAHIDLALLAVPHTAGMQIAPALLAKGITVVDVSADFRFHAAWIYEKWYGVTHGAPELISKAVYGLPEVYRGELEALAKKRVERGEAALVAAPGCYPTASVLAALPIIKAQLTSPEDVVVINAISGVSGAGKKPTETTQFCLANESLHAYGVATHRHTPEIVQTLSHLADRKVDIQFTPHLAPLSRGMVSTVTMRLTKEQAAGESAESIWQRYQNAYEHEPFVQVMELGGMPKSGSVKYSNYAHVGVAYDAHTRMVVASCALDNLGKGAAAQAVQCANILFSFDERAGLAEKGGLL